MKLEPNICYQALAARDVRFDGRFFVGVSSTGIYCRPICPSRLPKLGNCNFFPSAAAAESAGFRPCLRCRPEMAPGRASIDAPVRLAETAAMYIEEGFLNDSSVADLASRLGVTDRHLRRVFQSEFGVSPIRYAQTQRLLLAKRLLTETSLPIIDAALAGGFSSLRRFNDLFKSHYRLCPSKLRKKTGAKGIRAGLNFKLAYRPPFDWDRMVSFLGFRAINGVEKINGRAYCRSIRLVTETREFHGWIEVSPSKKDNILHVSLDAGLFKVIPLALSRIKRLFDLSCRPDLINRVLGDLATTHPGIRVPGAIDGFELAIRAVLGQQVSVKSAQTLAGRFAAAFGDPISTPFKDIKRVFPTPRQIAALEISDIASLGIVSKRAGSIIALSECLAQKELLLEPGTDIDHARERMMQIPGIGPWTANYIAMRALSWPDAFPASDLGILKAMKVKSPAEALRKAEKWRPWRAYAVMHLWNSMGG